MTNISPGLLSPSSFYLKGFCHGVIKLERYIHMSHGLSFCLHTDGGLAYFNTSSGISSSCTQAKYEYKTFYARRKITESQAQ